MKVLIVIALIVQLQRTLANDTSIKVVQPPSDKLYPIFELIATKMQEHFQHQVFNFVNIGVQLLPEYKRFVKEHNYEPYEGFENLLKSLEEYERDTDNCQLQRAVVADIDAAINNKSSKKIDAFFRNTMKYRHLNLRGDQRAIIEITERFPNLIRDFIENQNSEDKQKYAELNEYGEKILNAYERRDRYGAIERFMSETHYDEHFIEANDENCKWDLDNFSSFVNTMFIESLDLASD